MENLLQSKIEAAESMYRLIIAVIIVATALFAYLLISTIY